MTETRPCPDAAFEWLNRQGFRILNKTETDHSKRCPGEEATEPTAMTFLVLPHPLVRWRGVGRHWELSVIMQLPWAAEKGWLSWKKKQMLTYSKVPLEATWPSEMDTTDSQVWQVVPQTKRMFWKTLFVVVYFWTFCSVTSKAHTSLSLILLIN